MAQSFQRTTCCHAFHFRNSSSVRLALELHRLIDIFAPVSFNRTLSKKRKNMSAGSKKIIIAALLANLGIAISKFIASFVTNSSAMLAEAVHSLADTMNQVLLLVGLRLSERKASRLHPFGYGMERYFWSLIVALVLFVIGATFSIYEGFAKAIHPHAIESPIVNYVVLGIGIVLEIFSFIAALREFNRVRGSLPVMKYVRETKDPTVITVVFEDSAALIGLIVALLGVTLSVATGNTMYDGIASIVIGVLLGIIAVFLAWESKSLLIGEAASQENLDAMRAVIDRTANVRLVSEIMTMHLSPTSILANLSLDFDASLSSSQVEALTVAIEREMKTAVPELTHVFIEAAVGEAQSV